MITLSLLLAAVPACKSDRAVRGTDSHRDAAQFRADREARVAALAAIVDAELPLPQAEAEAEPEFDFGPEPVADPRLAMVQSTEPVSGELERPAAIAREPWSQDREPMEDTRQAEVDDEGARDADDDGEEVEEEEEEEAAEDQELDEVEGDEADEDEDEDGDEAQEGEAEEDEAQEGEAAEDEDADGDEDAEDDESSID